MTIMTSFGAPLQLTVMEITSLEIGAIVKVIVRLNQVLLQYVFVCTQKELYGCIFP